MTHVCTYSEEEGVAVGLVPTLCSPTSSSQEVIARRIMAQTSHLGREELRS